MLAYRESLAIVLSQPKFYVMTFDLSLHSKSTIFRRKGAWSFSRVIIDGGCGAIPSRNSILFGVEASAAKFDIKTLDVTWFSALASIRIHHLVWSTKEVRITDFRRRLRNTTCTAIDHTVNRYYECISPHYINTPHFILQSNNKLLTTLRTVSKR